MSSALEEKDPETRTIHPAYSSQASEQADSQISIDPIPERKLIRKLDFAFLPLFCLLNAANFLDRAAVGNAKIAGLEHDLGLHGFDFNIALTFFYVTYFIVDIPSNLALKRFGSVWLAFLIICFGVISLSTAFIHDFAGLIVMRLLLGAAEGGMISGLVYLLSRYYRRDELVMRVGIFMGIGPSLAGAFGGFLAFRLLSIPPLVSRQSWRNIFLVEGIITIGIGLLCIFIIPADPESSRFLTGSERAMALQRIAADRVTKDSKREKTTFKLVLRAFNLNTAICAVGFTLIGISFQGLILFMPTVVATLGHFSTAEAQLRTVPPYLVACVWAVVNSYISLRTRNRGFCIASSVLLSAIGYAIFVGSTNPHARYGACFLTLSGVTPAGPMFTTWAIDNAAPETVRAVTSALLLATGTVGSVIAVWTYVPNDAPNYHRGNTLNLVACSTVCVLVLVEMRYLLWENNQRNSGARDHRLLGKSKEQIYQLGARHPAFRYQL